MNRWLFLLITLTPLSGFADEPITARAAWEGRVDYFITGAPLAVDTDADFRVDSSSQPQAIVVGAADAPGDLEGALLYWGGSQAEPVAGACTSGSDDSISLTLPSGAVTALTADACYCSDGGGSTYDVWICHADITQALAATGGQIVGSYVIDGYDGLFMNGSTHNASASLVLVYGDDALPPRRVAAYDGNLNLFNTQSVITLDGIEIDTIPSGDLAFYVLEGDISGGGTEQVSVQSFPGGTASILSDALNPIDNPFNQTINTTTPPVSGVIGVDIDRFDVTSALDPMDDRVDVTVSAGNDRVWLATTVIGVDLFDPAFRRNSTKSVALFVDQNADGFANPGDTLRYTIRLENDGNEAGTVDLNDPIPMGVTSFNVVDAAGGTDGSVANEVRINGITVAAGASRSVIIDMVVDDVPDRTPIINTAFWSAPIQGGLDGMVSSVATEVHNPVVVDPDMGMSDMGAGDVGADMGGMDTGVLDPDMNIDPDMDGDTGRPGQDAGGDPDGGPAADAGADQGGVPTSDGGDNSPDVGGAGGSGNAKGSTDSGCCATTSPRQSPALLLLLVGALCVRLRRREHM